MSIESAKPKKAVLFANGSISTYSSLLPLPTIDFLVAVDGGMHHLNHLNLRPDLFVGDGDSFDIAQLPPGITTSFHERNKDKSDLELALEALPPDSFSTIIVYGALGGSTDHLFYNLSLLSRYPKKLSFLTDKETLFVAPPGCHCFSPPPSQKTCSLLPLYGPVFIHSTKGLFWNIENRTLNSAFMSLSNRVTEEKVSIEIASGNLLVSFTNR